MIKSIVLIASLMLVFGSFAIAQDGCGDDAYINAYVVGKAPRSLDIRDQPNAKGKILATVKTVPNDADSGFIVVVIKGFSNGWVKIASANGDEGSSFEGSGWVSANMAVKIMGSNGQNNKTAPLYAASRSKKKIGTIAVETQVLITDLTCGWVKVKYKTKVGWIKASNFCGDPVTSCS